METVIYTEVCQRFFVFNNFLISFSNDSLTFKKSQTEIRLKITVKNYLSSFEYQVQDVYKNFLS